MTRYDAVRLDGARAAVAVDVQALVPGEPERVVALADQLGAIATGLGAGAEALSLVGVDQWRGPAATAFLGALGLAPGPLRSGSHAFGAAAGVVLGHAEVLMLAQSTARAAVAVAEEGRAATAAWSSRSLEREEVATRAASGDAGAVAQLASMPALGADPGELARQRSERMLAEARQMVADSGRQVAAVLARAASSAPKEPNLVVRALVHRVQQQRQVAFGAEEVFIDQVVLALRTSTMRAVVNPRGWMSDTGKLAQNAASSALKPPPALLLSTVLDLRTWSKNPARAFGHLGGNVLTGMVSGGSSTAVEEGFVSSARPAAQFAKRANPPIDLRRAGSRGRSCAG